MCLGCPVQAESEPCVLSEGFAQAVPKVGGQCVRLISQSSDHFPLSAVDGSQLNATRIHYGSLARTQLNHQFFFIYNDKDLHLERSIKIRTNSLFQLIV
ncbi:unnamed protein product [Microthlaspi erraticum]|uniref:Uncharacterized protein n=1 Tax=Microthlaspi erraticum TaxID=1685480 RepID=A0A6D2KGY5_9BRAS|nr:unnamed protein product [Microthlaspi erraticum]